LTRDYLIFSSSFGAFFSPKLMITCRIAILVRFKWFEANQTRASELLQTLFCTKNGTPTYF